MIDNILKAEIKEAEKSNFKHRHGWLIKTFQINYNIKCLCISRSHGCAD